MLFLLSLIAAAGIIATASLFYLVASRLSEYRVASRRAARVSDLRGAFASRRRETSEVDSCAASFLSVLSREGSDS